VDMDGGSAELQRAGSSARRLRRGRGQRSGELTADDRRGTSGALMHASRRGRAGRWLGARASPQRELGRWREAGRGAEGGGGGRDMGPRRHALAGCYAAVSGLATRRGRCRGAGSGGTGMGTKWRSSRTRHGGRGGG
jgi:hypothetical protein